MSGLQRMRVEMPPNHGSHLFKKSYLKREREDGLKEGSREGGWLERERERVRINPYHIMITAHKSCL